MHKALLTSLVVLAFLSTAPQILALEIKVTPSGTVYFYEDGVLGETSDKPGKSAQERPIKSVTPLEGQKIRVSTEKDRVKVEVDRPTSLTTTQPAGTTPTLTTIEEVEVKRLRLQAPAAPTGENIQAGDRKTAPSAQRAEVRQERQQRHDETVELRNESDGNGQQRLQLKSRETVAELSRGAEFELDPETNQVTITTPSGNVHVLEHLPDQAIERMKEHGLFSDSLESEDISLETNEQGEVVYRTHGVRQKKVFGLFNREVTTEVELNDATGEVTESEVTSPSLFGQFLDAISF